MEDSEPINSTATEIQTHNQESVRRQMEALAADEELRSVVSLMSLRRFNQEAINYQTGDFDAMRKAMDVFDTRTAKDSTYGERADAQELILDSETDQRIYKLAEKFGLTGDTVPEKKEAVAALVLGGAGKAPLDRAAYTKELLENGDLQSNRVIFLASDRPVNEAEQKRGGEYATGAQTEFDLNIKACEAVFGMSFTDEDIVSNIDPNVPLGFPNRARVAHKTDESGLEIFIIAAPILTDPFEERNGVTIRRPRANTRDTYAMLQKVAGFQPGDHVVGVTNAHFVPFQGADARGQLGSLGIDAEIVGFDPSHFGNPQKTSQELLQEMLTAADSLAKAA